ncbi:acidic leucine-rich nuclear phosphoprotein 32 family member B-like [Capsicum annuum]
MYEQIILGSVDHLIAIVNDEPGEEMKEDPEKDLKEMDKDPKEDPEEDPEEDLEEDPEEEPMEEQDGELTEEMEEDPEEEEYGPIDFGGADEDFQGQQLDGSPEYHPRPYYDLDADDDDPPSWP